MEKLKTLLDEEIADEFSGLREIELGTDKYRSTVDGLTKLCDRAIEIEKFKAEQELKTEHAKDDKRDKIIDKVITGASIVIPAGLTVWGTYKSINFEKTGTITTIMGRGFIQKLLPKK